MARLICQFSPLLDSAASLPDVGYSLRASQARDFDVGLSSLVITVPRLSAQRIQADRLAITLRFAMAARGQPGCLPTPFPVIIIRALSAKSREDGPPFGYLTTNYRGAGHARRWRRIKMILSLRRCQDIGADAFAMIHRLSAPRNAEKCRSQ